MEESQKLWEDAVYFESIVKASPVGDPARRMAERQLEWFLNEAARLESEGQ